MSLDSFDHPRFGRFNYTGHSTRRAWRGHWDTLTLHLDTPEAAALLDQLPAALARFIDEAKLHVAGELLTGDNARWHDLSTARLAATLTPVALGALSESACITLDFEEGWPVISDISAELDLHGMPSFVGYTTRSTVALKPERKGVHQTERLGEVAEEHDAGETRYAITHQGITIRFDALTQAKEVEALRDTLEATRIAAATFAASALAPLWNASWREVGEPEMSAEAMAKEFTLAEIDLGADGAFEVTMHDGGLFAEHLVVASFNGAKWVHAGIEG